MAGISPIITNGFLFTPSLIVTAGFLSGSTPPPVIIVSPGGGSYGPLKKKKRKPIPSFVEEGPRPGDTIRDMFFREQDMADEEELLMMLGWLE